MTMSQIFSFLISFLTISLIFCDCYGNNRLEKDIKNLESYLKTLPVNSNPTLISYHENQKIIAIGDSLGVDIFRNQDTTAFCQLNMGGADGLKDHQFLYFNLNGNLLLNTWRGNEDLLGLHSEDDPTGGWHIPSGNPLIFNGLPSGMNASAFSPDGKFFIVSSPFEGVLLAHNAQTGLKCLFEGKDKIPWHIKIDKNHNFDSNMLVAMTNHAKKVVCAIDDKILVYTDGKLIYSIHVPNEDTVENISLSWTGETLAVVHSGMCSIWDLRPGTDLTNPIYNLNFEDYNYKSIFSLSPEGEFLISYHNDLKRFKIFKKNGNEFELDTSSQDKINAIGFTPYGAMIFLYSRSNSEQLEFKIEYRPPKGLFKKIETEWTIPMGHKRTFDTEEQDEMPSGRPRIVVQNEIDSNVYHETAPVLSTDGKILASIHGEGLFVWDTKTGRQLAQFAAAKSFFGENILKISDDGHWVACIDGKDDFFLFDILNHKMEYHEKCDYPKSRAMHPHLPIWVDATNWGLSFNSIDEMNEQNIETTDLDLEDVDQTVFSSDGTRLAVLREKTSEILILEQYSYPDLELIAPGIKVEKADSDIDMIALNENKKVILINKKPDGCFYSLYSTTDQLSSGQFPESFIVKGTREVTPGCLIDGSSSHMIQIEGDVVSLVDFNNGLPIDKLKTTIRITPLDDGLALLRQDKTREVKWMEDDGIWTLLDRPNKDPIFVDPSGRFHSLFSPRTNQKIKDNFWSNYNSEKKLYIHWKKDKRFFKLASFQDAISDESQTQYTMGIFRQDIKGVWRGDFKPVKNTFKVSKEIQGDIQCPLFLKNRLWVFVDNLPAYIPLETFNGEYHLKRFRRTGAASASIHATVTNNEQSLVIGQDHWVLVWGLNEKTDKKFVRVPGEISGITPYDDTSVLLQVIADGWNNRIMTQERINRGILINHKIIKLNLLDLSIKEYVSENNWMKLSKNGKALVSAGNEGFEILDSKDNRLLSLIKWGNLPKSDFREYGFEVSPDKRWLLVTSDEAAIVWDMARQAQISLNLPQPWYSFEDEVFSLDNLILGRSVHFATNSHLIFKSNLECMEISLPSSKLINRILDYDLLQMRGSSFLNSLDHGARIINQYGLMGVIPHAEIESIGLYSKVFPIYRYNMLVFEAGSSLYFMSIPKGRVIGALNFGKTQSNDTMPYWLLTSRFGHFQASDMDELKGMAWVFPSMGSLSGLSPLTFMATHYRPNLFNRMIQDNLDQPERINSITMEQPIVKIASIKPNVDPSLIDVTVEIQAPSINSANKAYDLKLFQNSRLVASYPPIIEKFDDLFQGERKFKKLRQIEYGTHVISIPKPVETADFYAYAYNRSGIKSEDSNIMTFQEDMPKRNGKLWSLNIGIGLNRYNPFHLASTPEAAINMQQVLKNSTGRNITPVLMLHKQDNWENHRVTAMPTKVNIAAVIARFAGIELPENHPNLKNEIRERILAQIQPLRSQDSLFISIHGHAKSADGGFYLMPCDLPADFSNKSFSKQDSIERAHSISDRELYAWLTKINCRQIYLMLDTCQAGAIIPTSESISAPLSGHNLDRLAYDKAMPILLASEADEFAQADKNNKNTVLVEKLQKISEKQKNNLNENTHHKIINLFLSSMEKKAISNEQNIDLIYHKRARILRIKK